MRDGIIGVGRGKITEGFVVCLEFEFYFRSVVGWE